MELFLLKSSKSNLAWKTRKSEHFKYKFLNVGFSTQYFSNKSKSILRLGAITKFHFPWVFCLNTLNINIFAKYKNGIKLILIMRKNKYSFKWGCTVLQILFKNVKFQITISTALSDEMRSIIDELYLCLYQTNLYRTKYISQTSSFPVNFNRFKQIAMSFID